MKYAVIALLALGVVFGTVTAGPENTSRRATETTYPVDYFNSDRAYFEGFEGTVPPAGWTLEQLNIYQTWIVGLSNPYEGSQRAVCYWDYFLSGPQDEWLKFDYQIQPGDEILGFAAFASTYYAIDPFQNYNLVVTIDDVTVWDYYNDNNGAVSFEWQEYTVDLSSYSVGQWVTIGFGYVGFDGAEGTFDAVYIGDEITPVEDTSWGSIKALYR